MDPRSLFSEGLTIPNHENNDLHYIGEALPNPSLITTSVSANTPAFIGGSPIPAREDHTHNLEFDVDLTNYYTKSEIDTMLDAIVAGDMDMSNYYTKAEIDTFNNILATQIDNLTAQTNINTSDISNLQLVVVNQDSRITTLEISGGSSTVVPIEKDWSYGHIVNPETLASLNRYVAFRDFEIVYIEVTYVLAADAATIIDLWHNHNGTGFAVVATVTLAGGSLAYQYVFTSPHAVSQGDVLYPTIHANIDGNGQDITISIRGQYT
jgi:hypothetical protein